MSPTVAGPTCPWPRLSSPGKGARHREHLNYGRSSGRRDGWFGRESELGLASHSRHLPRLKSSAQLRLLSSCSCFYSSYCSCSGFYFSCSYSFLLLLRNSRNPDAIGFRAVNSAPKFMTLGVWCQFSKEEPKLSVENLVGWELIVTGDYWENSNQQPARSKLNPLHSNWFLFI